MISTQNALLAADHVYHTALTIPEDQRGHTQWVHLGLDDIPSSAECMSSGADSGSEFPSLEAAQEYRKMLLADNVDVDHTIPRTQAQLRAHALALFKAFKCIPEECQDRDDMKKWFVDQRHNNQLVEVKCWEILHECINRSVTITNLVEAHEPNKFRFKAGSMTFAERFDIIKETMALSKTICKHLFDVSFALKFVDDPAHNRARVESNRLLNTKKAEIMRRGKEQQAKDKRDKQVKRPRLMRDINADPDSGEELDDSDDTDAIETLIKTESPQISRATRTRTGTRARAVSAQSASHSGSMSAPQMRTHIYPQTHMNMRNAAFQRDSSPLSNYSTSIGVSPMTGYGNDDNDQLTAAANLSSFSQHGHGGTFYSPQRQRTPLFSSSPLGSAINLNNGMNYAPGQTQSHPLMRPESSMSQHTLYQMPGVTDPWSPQTPSPRHTSAGPGSYNNTSGNHSGSSSHRNMAMGLAESMGFNAPWWQNPVTPGGAGAWARQTMAPPQYLRQQLPALFQPGNFMATTEQVHPAAGFVEDMGQASHEHNQDHKEPQQEQAETTEAEPQSLDEAFQGHPFGVE